MLFACAILFAALTRAELIDRFRAPRIVQVNGLVQVRADCGPDMRREFQLPIAGFAADICRRLYAAENLRERHFPEPGIVIVIGDVISNVTNVVSRSETRSDGTLWTRILVPSPGYADREAFTRSVTKGYYRAVHSQDLRDDEATERFRATFPELKVEDDYRRLEEWYAGKRGKEDDEEYLKLQRSVLQPGVASKHDVEIFASRLFLFPEFFDQPFVGLFDCVSFREAIKMARLDPRIRYAAHLKVPEVVLYSGGRGVKMSAAGLAFAEFLKDLFAYKKSEAELSAELDIAETLLKGVVE